MKPYTVDYMDPNWHAIFSAREDEMIVQNNAAIEKRTLVGRVVRHPYADGHAHYEVLSCGTCKSRSSIHGTVILQHIEGIGDNWDLPGWGERIRLPLRGVEHMFMPHTLRRVRG